MSICTIFIKNEDPDKKKSVGTIQQHHNMNNWLLINGIKDITYELYKGDCIHSVWIWKDKIERWGRTATPSTKPKTNTIEDIVYVPTDKINRKKVRQERAKTNKSGRQHRS
jgi:hypothetical protein